MIFVNNKTDVKLYKIENEIPRRINKRVKIWDTSEHTKK